MTELREFAEEEKEAMRFKPLVSLKRLFDLDAVSVLHMTIAVFIAFGAWVVYGWWATLIVLGFVMGFGLLCDWSMSRLAPRLFRYLDRKTEHMDLDDSIAYGRRMLDRTKRLGVLIFLLMMTPLVWMIYIVWDTHGFNHAANLFTLYLVLALGVWGLNLACRAVYKRFSKGAIQ